MKIIIGAFVFAATFASFTNGLSKVKCPVNEIYTACRPDERVTCQNAMDHEKFSFRLNNTSECTPGCGCKPFYIRSKPEGPCIPLSKCRNIPYCARREEFSTCVPPLECQLSCMKIDLKVQEPCNYQCKPGCQCGYGYVRDLDNTCKEARNCPQCDIDEVYMSQCHEKTCNHPHREYTCEKEKHKCFCKPGTYRTDDGYCVKLSKCDSNTYYTY